MLGKNSIEYFLRIGGIEITPPPELIGPASVDFRLLEAVSLEPGEFKLASTLEVLTLREYLAAQVQGRSSIGRLGLQVENAGFIDPGFTGQITLELVNFSKKTIRVEAGVRICQVGFHGIDSLHQTSYDHVSGYAGKYNGQRGATGSRTNYEEGDNVIEIKRE